MKGGIQSKINLPSALKHPSKTVVNAKRHHGDWDGLTAWRLKGIDRRLGRWGDNNRPKDSHESAYHIHEDSRAPASLVEAAHAILTTPCPEDKQALTHAAWSSYLAESPSLPLHPSFLPYPHPPLYPARPARPALVKPRDVPAIGAAGGLPPSGHMLHNLAHIELNAIDLALDTVVRFAPLGLPSQFYEDFFRVADDEARHLGWCLARMEEIGCQYGDMPAHDLLWEGAMMSSQDLDARLCIIPCGQEARGLDAGSRLAQRLTGYGDKRSASIVAQIALEERAHVAVGVFWHRLISEALGLESEAAFRSNLTLLCPDLLKGPFNHQERELVGLTRAYYDVDSWPEEARERFRVQTPAEAARKQGLGLPLDPPGPRLYSLTEGLIDRLGRMLEMEAVQSQG